MLNLAERYWTWKRNGFKFGLVTDKGFRVKRFGVDSFAVKAGFMEGYICMNNTGTWSTPEYVMKYCARSKYEIEKRFGKILGLESEETKEKA